MAPMKSGGAGPDSVYIADTAIVVLHYILCVCAVSPFESRGACLKVNIILQRHCRNGVASSSLRIIRFYKT